MISRILEPQLLASLKQFPVVGLVGARQTGKTTLAKHLAKAWPQSTVYLDLERPSDLAKLKEAELYLEMNAVRLVIVDEVQRKAELFPLLRSLVDAKRRKGRFLILGSASPDLIRQSSESLAGRLVYHELSPFSVAEIAPGEENLQRLWLRGGYPNSFLASSNRQSFRWREAFIQTHLERDIPSLGLRIPSQALFRFWQMVAHSHGQLWNASKIAASLGTTGPTVRSYLDLLRKTYMIRELLPYHTNIKKRMVKASKVYLRDSGLLHALLQIRNRDELLGNPAAGASWEGWVIEQILSLVPSAWRPWFYRTGGGAEIDLLLERPGRKPLLAIEIKLSSAPTPSKGFWSALKDLKNCQGLVVCPVKERFPLGENVYTLPVGALKKYFFEMT